MSFFIIVSVLLIKWKDTSIMFMIVKEKNLFNNCQQISPRFTNVNENGRWEEEMCECMCECVCVQVCAFIQTCVHVRVCAVCVPVGVQVSSCI